MLTFNWKEDYKFLLGYDWKGFRNDLNQLEVIINEKILQIDSRDVRGNISNQSIDISRLLLQRTTNSDLDEYGLGKIIQLMSDRYAIIHSKKPNRKVYQNGEPIRQSVHPIIVALIPLIGPFTDMDNSDNGIICRIEHDLSEDYANKGLLSVTDALKTLWKENRDILKRPQDDLIQIELALRALTRENGTNYTDYILGMFQGQKLEGTQIINELRNLELIKLITMVKSPDLEHNGANQGDYRTIIQQDEIFSHLGLSNSSRMEGVLKATHIQHHDHGGPHPDHHLFLH